MFNKNLRNFFLSIAALTIAIVGFGLSSQAVAGPKSKITTPVISGVSATQTSITIRVAAPSPGTGLPAGFSLQWMTAADYAANGNQWYGSDDLRLCKASFSGNAHLSRYNLAAGEVVTVNVGDFLLDEGASTNCAEPLICNTEYVFRAFGHATSTLLRSDFTGNLFYSTLPCGGGDTGGCTYTQGYWKTHGPIPTGNNVNEWNVTNLTLGTVNYTDLQLQSIFDKPAAGNGLIALSHQLIAAKLNVANGADPTDAAAAIAASDALIGNLVVPPAGGGYLAPGVTSLLTGTLANYNEGATGPGHCQ